MPRLTDLSHELLLQIVHFLIESDGPCKWDNYDVPGRLKAITGLSQTSSIFYRLLSPFLFRNIILHNTKKVGDAVRYLAITSQRAYVKVLYFKAIATGSKSQDSHDIDRDFPSSVKRVLSNLAIFPNLETLILDFDLESVKYDDFEDVMQRYAEETEQQIIEAEGKRAWRALQKQVFDAITTKDSNKSRELVVKTCPLKATSLFGSDQMNQWLAQLQSFSFQVRARDEGAGWCTNTFYCFHQYVEKLDHYFFNALTNVTRLTISGHEDGAVGLTAMHQALVPLKPEHVPKLRELEMRWYFIQETFVDFLKAHSTTLETSGAYEDWDINEPLPEDERCWHRFFHTYAASKPSALRHVTVVPEDVPLELDDETVQLQEDWKKQGKERRAFAYAQIDSKYGMLVEDDDENTWALRRGQDMEGWQELLAVVRANKEKPAA
ncbi:MAG: hypothetical protein LQ345_005776 [Seirophora villosa]|nr:MAG: hypothetical protein LQ345_005776 [Seirophora villosa]